MRSHSFPIQRLLLWLMMLMLLLLVKLEANDNQTRQRSVESPLLLTEFINSVLLNSLALKARFYMVCVYVGL